ncbi:zinc finger domain-containing protein [Saccharothrix obliqua]|uniref:zinc finger domain-containing protein n=1 Tax=Saccharothrix obliqua TaxID=2861747 RepID=UPI001C5F7331|nr:zinc finger domain-containing protein [Saccharothrix obliqua]MBW4717418.1 hypothetical protein [Saccharothrix obliqua]
MKTGGNGGCVPEWDEHANFSDTGQRGINELTGSTYEVWVCECGGRTFDRFPTGPLVQVFCRDCRGSGQQWDENAYVDCSTCDARGWLWTDPASAEGYTTDCPTCGGSGTSSDGRADCAVCDGSGEAVVWGTAGEDDSDEDGER